LWYALLELSSFLLFFLRVKPRPSLPFVLRRRQHRRRRSRSSRPASPPITLPTMTGVLFEVLFELWGVLVVEPESGSAVPEPELPPLALLPPGLLAPVPPGEAEPVFVVLDDAIVGVGVVCVLEKRDASTTNCGTSKRETMDAVSKHWYMNRSGEPVQIQVPHAGAAADWL
jgi:hypothetical protein